MCTGDGIFFPGGCFGKRERPFCTKLTNLLLRLERCNLYETSVTEIAADGRCGSRSAVGGAHAVCACHGTQTTCVEFDPWLTRSPLFHLQLWQLQLRAKDREHSTTSERDDRHLAATS